MATLGHTVGTVNGLLPYVDFMGFTMGDVHLELVSHGGFSYTVPNKSSLYWSIQVVYSISTRDQVACSLVVGSP